MKYILFILTTLFVLNANANDYVDTTKLQLTVEDLKGFENILSGSLHLVDGKDASLLLKKNDKVKAKFSFTSRLLSDAEKKELGIERNAIELTLIFEKYNNGIADSQPIIEASMQVYDGQKASMHLHSNSTGEFTIEVLATNVKYLATDPVLKNTTLCPDITTEDIISIETLSRQTCCTTACTDGGPHDKLQCCGGIQCCGCGTCCQTQ